MEVKNVSRDALVSYIAGEKQASRNADPLTLPRAVNATFIRAPQPETVRDYELLYTGPNAQDWTSLGQYRANHQRLRRHQFARFAATALRLKITATNRANEGRAYEIRCYAYDAIPQQS